MVSQYIRTVSPDKSETSTFAVDQADLPGVIRAWQSRGYSVSIGGTTIPFSAAALSPMGDISRPFAPVFAPPPRVFNQPVVLPPVKCRF